MTLPSGILNAIMTNIGSVVILKFVPLIKFHSKNKEMLTIVISMFMLSYWNMGFIVLKSYEGGFITGIERGYVGWIPFDFTPDWILYYGKMI